MNEVWNLTLVNEFQMSWPWIAHVDRYLSIFGDNALLPSYLYILTSWQHYYICLWTPQLMCWWLESGKSPRDQYWYHELSLKQSTGIRSDIRFHTKDFLYQPLKRTRSWRKLLHRVNSYGRTFFHSTASSIKAIRLNLTSWMQRLD